MNRKNNVRFMGKTPDQRAALTVVALEQVCALKSARRDQNKEKRGGPEIVRLAQIESPNEERAF